MVEAHEAFASFLLKEADDIPRIVESPPLSSRDAQPPVHVVGMALPTPHDRRPFTIVSVCWPFE